MTEDAPKPGLESSMVDLSRPFDGQTPSLEWFYAQAQAGRWRLPQARFAAALERSAKKALTPGAVTPRKRHDFLSALHLEDLALATACADGEEAAWEHFFNTYRTYLRAAAAAILRCPAGSAESCDLADSLFSELYGLADGKGAERSLFRYFHGRSSLKTWLRAVLAQRHIDAIRAGRKFDSLDVGEDDGEPRHTHEPRTVDAPGDPRREIYLQRFRVALALALGSIEPRDRTRLQRYYADDCTLAEIGKELGEHESSVSRNLKRVPKYLRATSEGLLRSGKAAGNGGPAPPAMDEAQIQLCIQYAPEDTAIYLDRLVARAQP